MWNTFTTPVVVDRVPGDGPALEPVDRDGDGVPSAEDNCPSSWNAEQADFDEDAVGDLCDFCPLDGPAPLLDADGCRALDDAAVQAVLAVVDDVMMGTATILDVVRKVDEVNP